MTRKLATYVHVTDENFQRHTFGPDDEVPGWAEKLITNPKAWKSDTDADEEAIEAPDGTGQSPEGQSDGGDGGDQNVDGVTVVDDPDRPRGNASREEWATYASGRGVDVTGQMGRDDIRAAVEALDAQQASEQQGD